jgi:hypothetical protein
MGSDIHGLQTVASDEGIHYPHSYEYADAAEREAESAFVTNDLYKHVLQLDDFSIWMAKGIDGGIPDWLMLHPGDNPWPVERGGTGNDLSGADDGSMFYFDTDRLLATDPADLAWDSANKQLRLGPDTGSAYDYFLSVIQTKWPPSFGTSSAAALVTEITQDNPGSDWIQGVTAEAKLHSSSGDASGWLFGIGATARYYGDGTSHFTGHAAGGTFDVVNHGSTKLDNAFVVLASLVSLSTGGYGIAKLFGADTYWPGSGTVDTWYSFHSPDKLAQATDYWHFYGGSGGYSYLGHPLLLGDDDVGSAKGRLVLKTGTTDVDGIWFGTDGAAAPNVYRSGDGSLAIMNANLSIGTPSATELLTLNKTSGKVGLRLEGDGADVCELYLADAGVDHTTYFGTKTNNSLYVQTAGTTRMVFGSNDLSGYIGVGKVPGYCFDVAGDINIDSGKVFRVNGVPGVSQTTANPASITTVGGIITAMS